LAIVESVGNRDNGSALLRFSGLSRAQHLKQAQINHQMIRYFHTFNLSSETSKASHSLTHCVTHLHQPPSDDAGTQDPPSTSPSPQPDPPASQHLCQQFQHHTSSQGPFVPNGYPHGNGQGGPHGWPHGNGRDDLPSIYQSQLFKTMLSYCSEPLNLITTNNSIYKQTLQTPNNF